MIQCAVFAIRFTKMDRFIWCHRQFSKDDFMCMWSFIVYIRFSSQNDSHSFAGNASNIHAKRGYFVVQRKRENHWINILQWKYIETVLVYVSLEESIWFYLCLLLAQRVSFFSLSVQFRPLFYFTEYTYGFQYFTW